MYRLRATFRFAAAHSLPRHPGKCANVHGHTYKVEVFIVAETLNPDGMVIDFGEIKAAMAALDHVVDHTFLNDLKMFASMNQPTAEVMAHVFFNYFRKAFLEHLPRVDIEKVRVHEDLDETWAEYEGT